MVLTSIFLKVTSGFVVLSAPFPFGSVCAGFELSLDMCRTLRPSAKAPGLDRKTSPEKLPRKVTDLFNIFCHKNESSRFQPALRLAFPESLLYLFFTEVARSSSRQKMGEAARKHWAQAERLQRGKIRTLALRRPEKFIGQLGLQNRILATWGFPRLSASPLPSCWEAHLSTLP